MKNLDQLNVKEMSNDDALSCNGGFWIALLQILLEKNADYQAFKEATGTEII